MGVFFQTFRIARQALRERVIVPFYRGRVAPGLAEVPWYDRPDADATAATLDLDPAEREQLARWRADGALVLPGAIDAQRLDAVSTAIDDAWAGRVPDVWLEHYPGDRVRLDPIEARWRGTPNKLLDLHQHAAAAAAVYAAPDLARWLHLLLGPDVVAFQSLVFERGTEQAVHRDTNFVGLTPPWQMVAAWIALEDVESGSGELEYYVGSHRLADYAFAGGSHYLEPGTTVPDDYSDHWHAGAAAAGLARTRFRPRRGDVLFWHAGLVHGGSPIERAGSSRRSLVTHFCPAGAVPAYGWDRRGRVERPAGPGLTLSAIRRRAGSAPGAG